MPVLPPIGENKDLEAKDDLYVSFEYNIPHGNTYKMRYLHVDQCEKAGVDQALGIQGLDIGNFVHHIDYVIRSAMRVRFNNCQRTPFLYHYSLNSNNHIMSRYDLDIAVGCIYHKILDAAAIRSFLISDVYQWGTPAILPVPLIQPYFYDGVPSKIITLQFYRD